MQNLYRFFNKKGDDITPPNKDGIYSFNLRFDPVSVGLFETLQIHIFEEVYVAETDKIDFDDLDNIIPESKLRRILKAIHLTNETNGYCYSSDLHFLFDAIYSSKDVVSEYCQKYPEYINIETVDYDTVYSLTEEGISILEYGDYKLEEKLFNSRGYIKNLTRPRFRTFDDGHFHSLFFKWKDNNSDDIRLFTISDEQITVKDKNNIRNEDETLPVFQNIYSKYLKTTDCLNNFLRSEFEFDIANWDYYIPDRLYPGRKIIKNSQLNQNPFSINLCISSETEGLYNKVLEVYIYDSYDSKIYQFCEINITGEVIGEDERLVKLLENFGRNIDNSDYYIIKDFDLNEDRLDYIKINEKRKELLLEGDDLFSYLGSYKSIKNGLKWLGYQDIKLREYFYNIQTWDYKNKKIDYSYVDISLEHTDQYDSQNKIDYNYKKYSKLVGSPTWKKTTRLGLIYDYNEFTGYYNEDGLPIIQNKTDFNPEELMVKMYGLKKFLYKYLLPHNARIINITMEGIYFTKVQIVNWNDILPISHLKKQTNFDVSVINPEQLLNNLYEFIELFKIHKKEHSELDDYNCLKDFMKKNKKLNDFIDTNLDLFNFKNISGSEQLNSDDIPTVQKVFSDILTFLDEKFESSDELKKYIIENFNLNLNECYKCEDRNDNISNKKKSGIFLLEAKENKVTIKDVANIPVGFFTISYLNCVDPGVLNSPDYYDLDNYNNQKNECDGKGYPVIKWTCEYFNIHNNSPIEWRIKHRELDYCKKVSGDFVDHKKYLFLAPLEGYYDVVCTIKDHFNFPNTKYKNKFLNVVEPEFDILCFGKHNLRKIDYNNRIDQVSGSFRDNYIKPNSLKSTFKEFGHFEINDATISNRLDCENYLEFVKSSPISNIDIDNQTIELYDNNAFLNDYNEYQKNWYNLYLYKDTRDYLYNDIPITKINKNSIEFVGNIPVLKEREILNIYQIFETKDFSVYDDFIKISLPVGIPPNIFRNDSIITLIESNTLDNETKQFKNKDFKVKYIKYDYLENKVTLHINNINKDLVFEPDETNDINAQYNYSNWDTLKLKYNLTSYRVTSFSNNVITLKGDLNKLNNYRNIFDITDNPLYFESEIIDVNFLMVDKNNYDGEKIKLEKEKICQITPGHKLFWGPFDLYKAKYNTRIERIDFRTLNNSVGQYTIADLKNETCDSFSFRGNYMVEFNITGFTNIIQYSDTNEIKLIINGNTYILKINMPQLSDLNTKYDSNIIFELCKNKVLDELNRLSKIPNNGPINNFYFVDSKEKIKALSRLNNGQNIYKLNSTVIQLDRDFVLPLSTWFSKDIYEFKNIENPPIWNDFYRSYEENKNLFNGDINDLEIYKSSYIKGRFDIGQTFIKSDNFTFDYNCPIFLTLTNKYYYNLNNWNFEWNLYRDTDNILICRSNLDYLNYIINENDSYTAELILTNKKTGKIKKLQKFAWFTKFKGE